MAGGMAMKRTLQSKVHAYLDRRRALGYQLAETGRLLLNFARYSDRRGEHGVLRNESVIRWASLPQDADPAYGLGVCKPCGWSLGIKLPSNLQPRFRRATSL